MTAAAPLHFAQVGKTLAGRQVLTDVTFSCPPGAITALLGPNGAGKTTTVTLATGLRRPATGSVTVFGEPARAAAGRGLFALVPQEIAFPDTVTVRRCLEFVAAQRAVSRLATSGTEICERLGLTAQLDRRVGGLSGGQRRKLAVALGLIRAPGLLIMDEATTNLDESTRAVTWQLVREFVVRGGAALVTSHILADIDSHADRVIALNAGRVVAHGPLDELRARLGGASSVAVRVPVASQQRIVETVARHGLGDLTATSDGTLRWRTDRAVTLVRALADTGAEVTDLTVRPVPLDEVLDSLRALSAGMPAAEPSEVAR